MSFDVEAVRKDFPILAREVHGVPLVYLDSANSAQKPQVVIDAEADLYANHYANVARAVHTLGSEVTNAYEGARDKVAAFLNAPSPRRDHLHPQHHRGAQPAGVLVLERDHVPRRRAVPARPRRRDRRDRDGAPQQHRPVAAAGAAHRRDVPLDPDRRRGPAGRVGHRRGHQRAHQDRLVRLPVQRARHDQPGPRASSSAPARSARCRSSTPPRPPRTCRSTCRSSAPTSSRSPATSCTARPASACCGAATNCSPSCRRSSAAAR